LIKGIVVGAIRSARRESFVFMGCAIMHDDFITLYSTFMPLASGKLNLCSMSRKAELSFSTCKREKDVTAIY
jgi:hypothetical protein